MPSPMFPALMIPGQWEPGSLTRFALSRDVVYPMVDITIGAATIAERRREGGAVRRRRPVRALWMAIMRRVRA